jgi:adenylylsulfate kinase
MSWAVWITGLPGSGKSVLARAAAEALAERGEPVTVLELDVLRRHLTPEPTYSDAERDAVYRALVYLAARLTQAGVPVIIDATAHRRAWRELARAIIPHFAEIQITCPLEICRERERQRTTGHAPRGIYATAGRPGATVPGVDVPYEPALEPTLTIDSATESPAQAAPRIVQVALDLARSAPPPRPPAASPAWALWITGLPGSGKTTLALAVTEALAARGVQCCLLELEPLRELLHGGRPAQEEIAHRALVLAARLLTQAGIPVIIDATAPRRHWRDLARALIHHYAEIQLQCPLAVCGARERAVRWTPARSGGGLPHAVAAGPDIVLDYEASLHPDLVVHTDVRSVGSATDEIVSLAYRLHRRSGASPCASAT